MRVGAPWGWQPLVDLPRLFDLWVEHYGQVAEQQRLLLPLRPVYFLEPAD